MDKKNDGMLQLLQDIKELLLGLALILLAIGVFLLGWILRDMSSVNADELGGLAGLVLLAFGAFHVWNGWTAHTVQEKPAENEPSQGGPHGSGTA